MTVEELIYKLKEYNPEAEVMTLDSDYGPVSICAVYAEDEENIFLNWEVKE